jgi:hypothetical protein
MSFSDKPKSWYKSKGVWAGIIIVIVNVWDNMLVPFSSQYFSIILPNIPAWIYSMLAALGIYGRVSASTNIGKQK